MADSKLANPLHILGPCLGLNQLCFASMLPLRPEFLFQIMTEQNVETLAGYEAEKKTIITACPHCFPRETSSLNEVPRFPWGLCGHGRGGHPNRAIR